MKICGDIEVTEDFKVKLNEYAYLLINKAMNVTQGTILVITAAIDSAYFVRILVKEAYKAGADNVILEWTDEYISKQKYKYASDETIESANPVYKTIRDLSENNKVHYLSIISDDPNAFEDVDSDRIKRHIRAQRLATKEFEERTKYNCTPWTVAAAVSKKWACKVFDSLSEDKAVLKLWDYIFEVVRVEGNGNVIQNWENHLSNMGEKAKILSSYNFKSLNYKNSLGTDLSIELPDNHVWVHAYSTTRDGCVFLPNIPTEEIFSAPKKFGTNGVVYSSMPLHVNGQIIEGIRFEIKNGKIIKAEAKKNQKLLETLVYEDDTSCYLGEIALVPIDSPIFKQNIIYYETLFDENACCHIAFGSAFPECIKGGENMSNKELIDAGINLSITHKDFMIGTSDLNIKGIDQNNVEVDVFKDGKWAI